MIWTAKWVHVDAGPKSDAEALEIGVKKFDAMVRNHNSERPSFGSQSEPEPHVTLFLQAQLFYGDLEPPIRFHINSYARGLLILAIGPESVMQLELNSPSSQRPGNVLRLWMNWVLREMLYLFVAQFIEADTPGESRDMSLLPMKTKNVRRLTLQTETSSRQAIRHHSNGPRRT
jgi:hypothetical protein